MTRTSTRLACVGIALLMVASVLSPVGGMAGTATAAEHSFVIEQGNRCVEVTPLAGSEDVVSFYDYRNIENTDGSDRYTYSSYMPRHLQQQDTSRLFLYDGPNGVSLVVIHHQLDGGGEGSAATFHFSGLPSSGSWVVQDDDYAGQDDRFSRNRIDWMWYADRTDGAVFRDVDRADTQITISPAFDEQAALYDQYDRTGSTQAWQFLSGSLGSPGTVALDMSQPVTIRTGHCGPDETPPSAVLSAGSGVVGQSVTFDARGSSDDVGVAEYQWDFDGDGEIDRVTTDPTVGYAYDESGTYDATVTVVDRGENSDAASASVAVETDDPPDPAINVESPETPVEGQQVVLDASNATDDTGIAAYRWEFSDGGTASGERVAHTFAGNGTYEVTLEVIDAAGNNATETTAVEVLPPDETPPDADLSATPETVEAGASVAFDADDASDDRSVASYHWDFGDGTTASGEEVNHTYGAAGTYDATVTVTDGGGNADAANATVEVRPARPPNVSAEIPDTVAVGRSFEVEEAATDGMSDIARYEWNFAGTAATGEEVSHTFNETGNYTVTLTAVDEAGQANSTSQEVQVVEDERAHPDPGNGDGGSGGDSGRDTGGSDNGGSDRSSSTGGTSSSSTNVGPPPVDTSVEQIGANEGVVDVRNARADETVRADLPESDAAEETGVAFRSVAVDLSEDNPHFAVETSRNEAESPPVDVSLGSLEVEGKYVEAGQVEGVTYEVAVQQSRLDEANLAPADLTAHVHQLADDGEDSADGTNGADGTDGTDGAWKEVNVSVEKRDETVVLQVEADALAPVVVGGERSVTVSDAELAAGEVAADQPVSVTATVENEGDETREFAANLTADGEVVATETVEVPAGEMTEVRVSETLPPGTHEVGLDVERADSQQVGSVTVDESPAGLSVADVSLNESAIAAGEQVAVTATVENLGTQTVEESVALTLFGEEVASETVEVEGSETAEVTFVRQIDAAGTHTAKIGDETAEVEVTDEAPANDGASSGVPIPGFGVGAAVVALVAAALLARLRKSTR